MPFLLFFFFFLHYFLQDGFLNFFFKLNIRPAKSWTFGTYCFVRAFGEILLHWWKDDFFHYASILVLKALITSSWFCLEAVKLPLNYCLYYTDASGIDLRVLFRSCGARFQRRLHLYVCSNKFFRLSAITAEESRRGCGSSVQTVRSSERGRSGIKRDEISGSLIHSCSCIETKANRRITRWKGAAIQGAGVKYVTHSAI